MSTCQSNCGGLEQSVTCYDVCKCVRITSTDKTIKIKKKDCKWDIEIDKSRFSSTTYINEGEGISVTGSGSQVDPFIITNTFTSDGTDTKIIAGSNITVTGTGTVLDPYIISGTVVAPVTSVNGQIGDVVLTTTNIAEGTNLYWTQGRFNTAFGLKNTDDLTEGLSNLYYTNTRARLAVSAGTGIGYDNLTGVISNTGVLSFNGRIGVVVPQLGDYTTSIVAEGSNLYYTDARTRLALSAGAGISYNNSSGVISANTTYLNANYHKQGGNSYTTASIIGTNDAYDVNLIRNGVNRIQIGEKIIKLSSATALPPWDVTQYTNLLHWDNGAIRSQAGGYWGINTNGYYTGGSNIFRYTNTGPAFDFNSDGSTIGFDVALSGTAGATFTHQKGMRIHPGGAVTFGTSVLPANIRTNTMLLANEQASIMALDFITLNDNAFQNTGFGWFRPKSGFASQMTQYQGDISFKTAVSSTANSAISWNDVLTIKNSGNVIVGSTTDAGQKLDVHGSSIIRGNLGVGIVATALLHLKAGVATVGGAPQKFTVGVNTTIPEIGTIEYDGSNFFATNSTGVRGIKQVNRTIRGATGTLSLSRTYNKYVFTGTTTTWTLPTIIGNTDVKFYIKNKGTGNITLNSNTGGAEIYDTSALTTYTILPGESVLLWNDSVHWDIHK